jgi:DNA mismatch repair protein MSH5
MRTANLIVDDVVGSYILDIRQAADFRYDTAKEKLAGLELEADDAPNVIFRTAGDDAIGDAMYGEAEQTTAGKRGRLLRLAGWIDLGSYLTVRFLSVDSFHD